MNRIIFITEEIYGTGSSPADTEPIMRRIAEHLLLLENNGNAPIHVFIDTEGGSIKTALSLFDLFNSCKSPIYTYGLSEVSSAGILVFLAGSKRYAFSHTQFMSHPGTISATASSVDFEATAGALLDQGSKANKIFKTVLKISEKKYKELHTKTNYIWADEALKLKIVTEILNSFPKIESITESESKFSRNDMELIDKAVTYYKTSKQQFLSMES